MTQHRLYGLRGKAYVTRYKQIFESDRVAILAAFNDLVGRDGKFTPMHLGQLCNQFQVPVKVMDDFLPEITNRKYSAGTWQRLKDRGCKAKDIGVTWERDRT
jgi:hypothetical protein